MRQVILATYNGPAGQDFEPGKFYPLLVESDPGWIRRRLKRWHRDHKVIVTLPEYLPYTDWDTFWGHWKEQA